MKKKQIIEAMHNKLHEIEPHAKAILFGSRARGTEKEGSDWDVLILLDKPKVTLQDYDKYSYPLRELGWDINEMYSSHKKNGKRTTTPYLIITLQGRELQYDKGTTFRLKNR